MNFRCAAGKRNLYQNSFQRGRRTCNGQYKWHCYAKQKLIQSCKINDEKSFVTIDFCSSYIKK